MEDEIVMRVEFDLHGAVCAQCGNIRIETHFEPMLKTFAEHHKDHKGFAYLATIASPPELVNGQMIELSIDKVVEG